MIFTRFVRPLFFVFIIALFALACQNEQDASTSTVSASQETGHSASATQPTSQPIAIPLKNTSAKTSALQRSLRVKTVWSGSHDPAEATTVTLSIERGMTNKKMRRINWTEESGETSLEYPAAWKILTVHAEHAEAIPAYRQINSTTTDTLEITLKKAGTVFGVVRKEGSNEPVAGAEVWVSGSQKRVKSAADGSYEIRVAQGVGLPSMVGARKGSWVATTKPGGGSPIAPGARVGPIDLVLKPGYTVFGTVTEAKTKNAIPGLLLMVSQPQGERRLIKTDAEGKYRAEGLIEGRCSINVRESKSYQGSKAVTLGKSPEEQVDLELQPATIIYGRTLNARDKQIVPFVTVTDRTAGSTTISDENGAYELVLGNQSSGRLFAYTDELVTTIEEESQPVAFKPAERTGPVDLLLHPGLALSGSVKEKATGKPIANATLSFYSRGLNAQTMSGKDGIYAYKALVAGEASVTVSAPDFVSFHVQRKIQPRGENRLDVELEKGATIFGRVLLESDRSPVAGASVAAMGSGQAFSDAEGKFELKNVASGKARIEASKDALVSALDDAERLQLEVAPGQRSGPHELLLKQGLVLTGRVTDGKTNLPIANATVQAYTGRNQSQFTTDVAGIFTIPGLSARNFQMNVDAEGYMAESVEVQITKDGANSVDVSLNPATTVHGHVWIEKKGAPASNARVMLQVGNTSTSSASQLDGSYEVEIAAGGASAKLSASKPPFVSSFNDGAMPIQIKEGQRNGPFDLILQRGMAVVGTVIDSETRAPIPNATVQRGYGENDLKTTTDASGKYRLEGFGVEEIWLEAFSRDHVGQRQRLKTSAGTDAVCNFTLERGGDVELRVLDEQQQPVGEAFIYLHYLGGNTPMSIRNEGNQRTDAKGVYIFHGISRTAEAQITASSKGANGNTRVSFPAGQLRTTATIVLKKSGESEDEAKQNNTLTGKISDANGQALSGVNVRVGGAEQLSYKSSHVPSTTSTGTGDYTLTTQYSSHGRQNITAYSKGYAINTKLGSFGTKDNPGRLDFTMEPEHYLDVTVIDMKDQPVANASLSVNLQRGGFWLNEIGKTDTKGKARVGMLPAGRYNVNANAPDGRHGSADSEADQAVTIQLSDLGKVHGRVVDRASKTPITNFTVDRGGDPVAYTDPSGEFTIERVQLNSGTTQIQIRADGYGPLRTDAPVLPVDSREVTVFELSPAQICQGVLVDAKTSARISGARVIHYRPYSSQDKNVQWQHYDTSRTEQKLTGADGSFVFQEGEEKGVLMIKAAGYERRVIWPNERPASTALQPMTIPLTKGASIEGKLIAPPQVSLNYSSLQYKEHRGFSYSFEQGKIGSANSFRWDSLSAGVYSINLGYTVNGATGGSVRKEVTLKAGEDLKIEVQAPLGASTLYGIITMSGKPMQYLGVHLAGNDRTFDSQTDDRGNYRFDQVDDGTYRIAMNIPDLASGDGRQMKSVTREVTVKGATRFDVALSGPNKVRAILMLSTDPAPGKWRMDSVGLWQEDQSGTTNSGEIDRYASAPIRNGQVEFTGYLKGRYKTALKYTATNGQVWQMPMQIVDLDNLQADQDLGGLLVPALSFIELRSTPPLAQTGEITCQIQPTGPHNNLIGVYEGGGRSSQGMWMARIGTTPTLLGPVLGGPGQIMFQSQKLAVTPGNVEMNLPPGQILPVQVTVAAR